MAAVLEWTGVDEEPVPASFPSSQHRTRGRRTPVRSGQLPPKIEAAIWRGTELGSPVSSVLSSGIRGSRRGTPRRRLALPFPDRNPSAPSHGRGMATPGAGHAPSRCRRRKHRRGRPTEISPSARTEARRARRAPFGLDSGRVTCRAPLGHRAARQDQRSGSSGLLAASGTTRTDSAPVGMCSGLRRTGLPVQAGSRGT